MTRLLIPFGFTFFILLSACSNEGSETTDSLSGKGLPQSQRTQEDSPAGVKFNDKTQFKSLSDPDHK